MFEEGGAEVVLRLDRITKRFGALTANDAVSFDLRAGEVIALLGENGAGKTTLMNILFGHYTADAGRVEVSGRPLPAGQPRAAIAAGLGMVHQHFTLAENLSVLDNITLGTRSLWSWRSGRGAARARVEDLAARFGLAVDPDARVADLSVGERQRVEILKALYRDARILILDEPTAVLTPQETDDLFATLRTLVAEGLSVIFISHKMREVLAISSRVLVLRHGRLVGEVATAETDRAALAAMMVGGTLIAPEVRPAQEGPVRLRLVDVSTPDGGGGPGLKRVRLDLCGGRITGLAGVSGNGQRALADLIAGLVSPAEGRIEIDGKAARLVAPRGACRGRRADPRGSPFHRHDRRLHPDRERDPRRLWRGRPSAAPAGSTGARPRLMPATSSPITTSAARDRRRGSACSPAATCRS